MKPGIYSFKYLTEVFLKNVQSECCFKQIADIEYDELGMKTKKVVKPLILLAKMFDEK